jgi:hypothetical protein
MNKENVSNQPILFKYYPSIKIYPFDMLNTKFNLNQPTYLGAGHFPMQMHRPGHIVESATQVSKHDIKKHR